VVEPVVVAFLGLFNPDLASCRDWGPFGLGALMVYFRPSVLFWGGREEGEKRGGKDGTNPDRGRRIPGRAITANGRRRKGLVKGIFK